MPLLRRASGRAHRLMLAGLCAAGLLLPIVARAAEADRRWGIGWDGRQGAPMLRWRPAPAWDLTLAAGPDDWKSDGDEYRFDSSYTPQQQGNQEHTGGKRESGWVGISGGRRVWSDGRFAMASVLGVSVRWENSEDTFRSPVFSTIADVQNRRSSAHGETWALEALLRPSFALSSRASVEFDCGLQVAWTSSRQTRSTWYDVSPDYNRAETSSHSTTFRTIGRFEWAALKFVFWL